MAKAVVSSGGGGSFGKSVDWADALVAELSSPPIPQGALTAAQLYAKARSAGGFTTFRENLAARPDIQSALFSHGGRMCRFYWPK